VLKAKDVLPLAQGLDAHAGDFGSNETDGWQCPGLLLGLYRTEYERKSSQQSLKVCGT
jgi:hypothetical protein